MALLDKQKKNAPQIPNFTSLSAELIWLSYATPNYMLLLIVTLTLFFNGNGITTHLTHIKIYN